MKISELSVVDITEFDEDTQQIKNRWSDTDSVIAEMQKYHEEDIRTIDDFFHTILW